MSDAAETVERAIVFEDARGERRERALQCVLQWLQELDECLLQVDLGQRADGLTLFVILRMREDTFDHHAQMNIVTGGEHAGGRVLSLSELDYRERGDFLSRFNECAPQRLGLQPHEVPAALAGLPPPPQPRAEAAPAQEPAPPPPPASPVEQRRAVRHPVRAPAAVTTGTRTVSGAVANLSAVGALVHVSAPPKLEEKVELEVKLPTGAVRAAATVVEVSERGVALNFTAPAPGLAEKLAALPAEQKGPERVGPWELLSLLGTGGTGEVHFARVVEGPQRGQHVALKRLTRRRAQDPEARRRLEAEAKTLSLLKHPSIVRTLEAGVFDGQQCLVMELIEGHDLGQILRRSRSRKRPLPVDVACFAAKVLLDALSAVHEAKDETGARLELVHGDVSPHNLFVSKAGVIKLGDFGLSRPAGTEPEALKRGRPSYLSPEALDGEVSQAMDLWAAAVTLYELITLEQPFVGNTLDELTTAIRRGKELPVRERRDECSGPLEAVLRCALEKDPALRFQSAREFAAAVAPHFHPVRTPRLVAEVVRGLFS